MCEYCDMILVNVENACKDYFIHKPLHLREDDTCKRIKSDGNNPTMYLREYRKVGLWELVCELSDDKGTVIKTPIIYCPTCGRKLLRTNNIKEK